MTHTRTARPCGVCGVREAIWAMQRSRDVRAFVPLDSDAPVFALMILCDRCKTKLDPTGGEAVMAGGDAGSGSTAKASAMRTDNS